MTKKYSVSFVIPVYKSENTINNVVDDISKLQSIDWEIILINDNSPDDVDSVIKKIILKYPNRITYLRFRKNYGQHSAILEGFKYVNKELVVTIDDDGQNPPEEILKMIQFMDSKNCDYDVVYGVLKDKKHSLFRNILSRINRFFSIMTINNKDEIPITNVRLMKKELVSYIANASSSFNFIDGLIFSLTDHIGYISINHKKRECGKSSYSYIKLLKLWLNHIIGYSNIFIKSISFMSFFISLIAFVMGLIYLFSTINNLGRPSGWLSTYLTMTFLFSVMFLILGIMSEYVGRIYVKTNHNNKIIVENVHTHD